MLSQNPWRSVDGYAGHSAGVQLLALVSVAMLAASTVSVAGARLPIRRPNVSSCSKIRSDLTQKLTFAGQADYSVSSS